MVSRSPLRTHAFLGRRHRFLRRLQLGRLRYWLLLTRSLLLDLLLDEVCRIHCLSEAVLHQLARLLQLELNLLALVMAVVRAASGGRVADLDQLAHSVPPLVVG